MAETITRQYREPFVESAGLGVTNEGLRLLKQNLPTSTYTGRSFVADQSGLESSAAKAAADLGQLTGTVQEQLNKQVHLHLTCHHINKKLLMHH